ncbi:MAG: hypothetical protein E6R03_01275 [Hyphomicrobiaceae bacterium]|nr:MAG: hypothetical protein E6R03_01275 [Hyphomicrobiaceae bacterium]
MAVEQHFDFASWPGIPDFERAYGTFSHGHEPSVITAESQIPPIGIVPYGNFTFSDGIRTVTLYDCKLSNVQTVSSSEGFTYIYRILDRRWRWRFGEISGHYNARDRRDNLIPWQARSPRELAAMLFGAMGETRYEIDLPDGISSTDLNTQRVQPAPGEKTPETRTNPEVVWDGDNPAAALDRLAQQYNRRFFLCPIRNIPVIARPGYGAALPDNDNLENVQQSLESIATPAGVGILGSLVRIQMRLKLVAVGEEWDGRFLPIDELSYRPARSPQKGQWVITFSVESGATGQVIAQFGGVRITGVSGTGASSTASGFQGALNVSTGLTSQATVEVTTIGDTVVITVTEVREGQGLDFSIIATVNGSSVNTNIVEAKASRASAWEQSDPNSFDDVTATDRLSYKAAQALALKSVFRYYRVADDDVSAGWDKAGGFDKIIVPGYGKIDNRLMLMLQPTMVEQAIPAAREEDRQAGGSAAFLAEVPDYYDGYSRDRQAVVYGQIATICQGEWFTDNHRLNTPEDRRISVPFSIDSLNQIAIFGGPVYTYYSQGRYQSKRPARLTLETAVSIRDEKTFAPIRFRRWMEFAKQEPGKDFEDRTTETTKIDVKDYKLDGGDPRTITLRGLKDNSDNLRAGQNTIGIEWHQHPDVPYAIIAAYVYDERTKGYIYKGFDGEQDDVSNPRADYYLAGHVLEHQPRGGQSATYNGIQPIDLDGAIAQVSWEVGDGATTTASRNVEHDMSIPPLNARRRRENLAADETAAKQNREEAAKFAGTLAAAKDPGNAIARQVR